MYIMSTNLYVGSSDYHSSIPADVITSERYFNCENFYSDMISKKFRLFHKNRPNKKR
jgi:hypothetical protein